MKKKKSELTHVVVVSHACWADEFDCEAVLVTTIEDWDAEVARAKAFKGDWESAEVGFGTNESLQFSDFSDWFRSFKVTKVSEEDAKKFATLLGMIETKDWLETSDGDDLEEEDRPSTWLTFGTGDNIFNISSFLVDGEDGEGDEE